MALMKSKLKSVHIAKVVRENAPINIGNLSIDAAIEHLTRFKRTQQEPVNVTGEYRCFPWDGARAWAKVLERECGWINMEKTPGFFGPTPPALINVEVAPGVYEKIPWGRMTVPNIEGYFQTGVAMTPGGLVFRIASNIKRKYEDEAKRLFDLTRAQLAVDSIYRGKTVRLSFHDDDGARYDDDHLHMIQPRFVDLSNTKESGLVFSDVLNRVIQDYLFTHLRHREAAKRLDIPGKRGAILHGAPGTGKTLTMMVAAKLANSNNITVFYADSVKDFEPTIKAASTHLPALVVCEDIDRALSGGRSEKIDKLLNFMDGISTKNEDISIILTSNNIEAIEQTALRPGRADLVLEFTPPDAGAVLKLFKLYSGEMLEPGADLASASHRMRGQIPAVIREVVNRAKLSALARAEGNIEGLQINGEDLDLAAISITQHMELLNRKKPRELAEENQVLLDGLTAVAASITTLGSKPGNGRAGEVLHAHDTL